MTKSGSFFTTGKIEFTDADKLVAKKYDEGHSVFRPIAISRDPCFEEAAKKARAEYDALKAAKRAI